MLFIVNPLWEFFVVEWMYYDEVEKIKSLFVYDFGNIYDKKNVYHGLEI